MIETLLGDERAMFRDTVRRFAESQMMPFVKDWDKQRKYPAEYYKKISDIGFMGLMVPEEYGGMGGHLVDVVILGEEMGRAGVSIPLTHISACCRAIAQHGNEEQKKRYLPDMASGKKIGSYCQTEPNAGSDSASMTSFAEMKNGYYLLNGRKNFISNAAIASVFIVLAKTEKDKGSKGISVFIVDRDTPGISVGKDEEKMGRHCSSMNDVIFEDVKVPAENLLVPAGRGFKEMMVEFNSERCGNSSLCIGMAQGAYERAVKFCQQRVQFRKPIAEFQGIQWTLAEMAIQIQAARLLVYDAAFKADRGKVVAKEAAMAKKFANEMSTWVVDKAIQLHGGYGYMSEYEVERYYRDVRGWSMGGGTTQICLNRIAYEILKTGQSATQPGKD
ncbi:MAG: acyl-CoA dehydrogenase family protein [Betaproteobacteria bacterium]|nr:acyl-CoA dehydrogenase family protein [Betaproteobacteria bacterium]